MNIQKIHTHTQWWEWRCFSQCIRWWKNIFVVFSGGLVGCSHSKCSTWVGESTWEFVNDSWYRWINRPRMENLPKEEAAPKMRNWQHAESWKPCRRTCDWLLNGRTLIYLDCHLDGEWGIEYIIPHEICCRVSKFRRGNPSSMSVVNFGWDEDFRREVCTEVSKN